MCLGGVGLGEPVNEVESQEASNSLAIGALQVGRQARWLVNSYSWKIVFRLQ